MIFVELEGLDVTRVTFGSNGIHTRFIRLAGIVRTSFSNEPHLFSAHLQEDGALEFKEDRHAQNVHTVKNLAFVVCRAKGRLRLAVLLGSGLVRSFGVLVFRKNTPPQAITPQTGTQQPVPACRVRTDRQTRLPLAQAGVSHHSAVPAEGQR